jgi:hypothetical protein
MGVQEDLEEVKQMVKKLREWPLGVANEISGWIIATERRVQGRIFCLMRESEQTRPSGLLESVFGSFFLR